MPRAKRFGSRLSKRRNFPHRRVYIATNAELSRRHPDKVVVKVGYTDGLIARRLQFLNARVTRATSEIYGGHGVTLCDWEIDDDDTTPAKRHFEKLVLSELEPYRLPGYFTYKRQKVVRCTELFAVPLNFVGRYVQIDDDRRLRFKAKMNARYAHLPK